MSTKHSIIKNIGNGSAVHVGSLGRVPKGAVLKVEAGVAKQLLQLDKIFAKATAAELKDYDTSVEDGAAEVAEIAAAAAEVKDIQATINEIEGDSKGLGTVRNETKGKSAAELVAAAKAAASEDVDAESDEDSEEGGEV